MCEYNVCLIQWLHADVLECINMISIISTSGSEVPIGGKKKIHLNAGQLRKDTKDTKSTLTTRVGKLSVHAFEDYLLTLTFKYILI